MTIKGDFAIAAFNALTAPAAIPEVVATTILLPETAAF